MVHTKLMFFGGLDILKDCSIKDLGHFPHQTAQRKNIFAHSNVPFKVVYHRCRGLIFEIKIKGVNLHPVVKKNCTHVEMRGPSRS